MDTELSSGAMTSSSAAFTPATVHGRYVDAELHFARPEDLSRDEERPALLRARTIPVEGDPRPHLSAERCRIYDLRDARGPLWGLDRAGFDQVNLTGRPALSQLLEGVARSNRFTPEDASRLRRMLLGRSFPLRSGGRFRLLFLAGEGTILRKAGPNGARFDPEEPVTGTSGHDAASAVHTDQDVLGTPLKQWLRGLAPRVFHHHAPDSDNGGSRLFLANLWIPLQQVTRPLALLDGRTMDRKREQARYALPVSWFMKRGEATSMNDLWHLRPSEQQRWYYQPDLDAHTAYLFDTLSCAHGSFVLPGEEHAEELSQRLLRASRAARAGDQEGLREAADTPEVSMPESAPETLCSAVAAMELALREAARDPAEVCARAEQFSALVASLRDRVVRKSIELRTVGVLYGRSLA